jgi:4-hydroxy-tetrahydrodipicolinate synthase
LADHPNIAGLKDCCADRRQSLELLRRRPQNFAVLTGEDAQYQEALTDGADGGILASAHIETETFAQVWKLVAAGEREAAQSCWQSVAELTRLLFAEPSPAPIKYWLWRSGLIDSPELRLPMTEVSTELAARLDLEIERRGRVAASASRASAAG